MPNSTFRIAGNTIILGVRMGLVMLINLYTVRIVLSALGEEGYGIFNTVAGIVTTLGCVSTSMSSAIQRYYSYQIGKGLLSGLKETFTASTIIVIVFSLFSIIVLSGIGLILIDNYLVIPESSLFATKILLFSSIFAFIFTMIQIPFVAAIISMEHLGVFAVISLCDCLLKLVVAIILEWFSNNKLEIYGWLLAIESVLVLFAYMIYCIKKYDFCRLTQTNNCSIYKSLLSFSGWSLYGSVAGVGMIQINTILVNIFFGPIVNAARAIALQINNALSTFCNCFVMAIRPPMIKAYAEEDDQFLQKIFILSNKILFYGLLIIAIPLIINMDYILSVWLGNIANDTILFSQLIVIYNIVFVISHPITILVQAANKVKQYHLRVEFFTLLCMPLTYIFFELGYDCYWTFILMIVVMIFAHVVRVIELKKCWVNFSIKRYLVDFIYRAIICFCFIFLAVYLISLFFLGFWSFLVSFLSSVLLGVITSLYIGLIAEERRNIYGIIKLRICR